MIWNAYGKMLYKDTMTLDLTKVCWRPRPVYIIDEKVEKEINKNYKDYKTKYELSDDKILNKIKYEREAKIKIQKETFLEYISKCK
jgi:hypothetical protein